MKNGILKGKGLDLGAEPPCINLLGTPCPPSLRFVVTRSIMRGALGFSVLRFWLFFRSVFVAKDFGFSVLVVIAVCGFFVF